jgi:hypothetical protein
MLNLFLSIYTLFAIYSCFVSGEAVDRKGATGAAVGEPIPV